jgi:hypothetical protein
MILFVCTLLADGVLVFNNISVISWLKVLLVEETGEPHQSAAIGDRH